MSNCKSKSFVGADDEVVIWKDVPAFPAIKSYVFGWNGAESTNSAPPDPKAPDVKLPLKFEKLLGNPTPFGPPFAEPMSNAMEYPVRLNGANALLLKAKTGIIAVLPALNASGFPFPMLNAKSARANWLIPMKQLRNTNDTELFIIISTLSVVNTLKLKN